MPTGLSWGEGLMTKSSLSQGEPFTRFSSGIQTGSYLKAETVSSKLPVPRGLANVCHRAGAQGTPVNIIAVTTLSAPITSYCDVNIIVPVW